MLEVGEMCLLTSMSFSMSATRTPKPPVGLSFSGFTNASFNEPLGTSLSGVSMQVASD